MNQEKIDKFNKYFIGFLVIFSLLFYLFAHIVASNGNKQYVKDTERVTELVEALENNTTNIEQNLTLEEALKLVSDDSELSSVKKDIKHLKDTYPTDNEYRISSLSNRVNEVELKLNKKIEEIKEEKERQEQEEREKQKKLKEEAEKKSNEENRKVDLNTFYNAIQEGVDKVNTQSGVHMLEMEKTSVTPGIRIILTENNASYSNKELRAIISALNKSLYKIAKSHGVNSPRFYYTLSDEEVAVNRYIMAPDEVKFSGILK
jgi:hypothetical protein